MPKAISSPDFYPIEFDGIRNAFPHCVSPACFANPVEFDGFKKRAGLTCLNQIAIEQMKLLTADDRTPKLPVGRGRR